MGTGLVNVEMLKGAGEAIGKIGGLVKDIRVAITGKNPEKLAEIEARAQEIDATIAVAQSKINEIEAAHPSTWVSGWRPGIGWVCVVSLACYYIPRFTIGMILWTWACIKAGALVAAPELGIAEVLGLVGSLLGTAALRSYDKKNKVARMN